MNSKLYVCEILYVLSPSRSNWTQLEGEVINIKYYTGFQILDFRRILLFAQKRIIQITVDQSIC